MTPEERITILEERVTALALRMTEQERLHTGLVDELKVLLAQLGPAAAQARDPAIMARARRIAAIRAERAGQLQ